MKIGRMGAVSPRDCGISLGTYLFYFHFFTVSEVRFCTTNLRGWRNVTDGMVIVVFGF